MSVAVSHRIDGPADGPVIVLGNSLGTDYTMWDACAERLVADGLRVIRYDHRGQGGSPDPGGEPSIAELAGDVIALLDRLGIERAAYAGVSIGGMVAQWLAAHAADRIVWAGIFCSSAHPGNPADWDARSATVLAAGSTETIAEAVVGRWLTTEFAAAHPDARERLLTMVRASPVEGYARLCRLLGRLDLRAELGAVQIPALVVAGAQDESLPPGHSELIAAAIPGANYELVDPAAHIPMVQRPEYVAEIICEYLEETVRWAARPGEADAEDRRADPVRGEGAPNPGRDSTYVQSLERGLAVIRALDGPDAQTLSAVARTTGLSRASARRFLLTLDKLGYVRQYGGRFRLTPQVLALGHAYLSSLTLPEIAGPHLAHLVDRVHESSSVSVLDGDEIVYVARVPARRIMSVAISIGTRFPAHQTSMGRVLLAGLSEGHRAMILRTAIFEARTPKTITTREQLDRELARVAAQGYALVDQELELGLRSIAVPILAASQEVVAALNISVPAASMTAAELRRRLLGPLRETATAISRDLGAPPAG